MIGTTNGTTTYGTYGYPSTSYTINGRSPWTANDKCETQLANLALTVGRLSKEIERINGVLSDLLLDVKSVLAEDDFNKYMERLGVGKH